MTGRSTKITMISLAASILFGLALIFLLAFGRIMSRGAIIDMLTAMAVVGVVGATLAALPTNGLVGKHLWGLLLPLHLVAVLGARHELAAWVVPVAAGAATVAAASTVISFIRPLRQHGT